MGTRNEVVEAQFVEIDGQPMRVEVRPQPRSGELVAVSQAAEAATRQRLASVPSVRDLPNWEDGRFVTVEVAP